MIPDIVYDWKDAIYHLEENSGYFDNGDIRNEFFKRIFKHTFWLITSFLIIGGVVYYFPIGDNIRPITILTSWPGSFGAGLLAWSPLRSDIHKIHFRSMSPEGVKKDRMPKPIIRDINRIVDRTVGLFLVATAFFFQIFL